MALRLMDGAKVRVFGMIGAGALLATGVFGAGTLAQDETPAAVGHPAHIHSGTCAELDPNPLVPLKDVTLPLVGDDEDQAPTSEDIKGAIDQPLVQVSENDDIDSDVTFDELFETSHAINVHESAENIDVYIACGDIGGVVADDEVFIPLYTQNDSGYFGIAKISKDDDSFDVQITLAQPQSESAALEARFDKTLLTTKRLPNLLKS
jgi:hypothetical protein